MTRIVRTNYGIDDRIKKAWYINPGHNWASAAGKSLFIYCEFVIKALQILLFSFHLLSDQLQKSV
jgi:hypothetical protein